MDSRLGMFGLNFPSRNAVENFAQYHTDNTFLIDALDSKGIKRKWSDVGGRGKESVSLALGLGRLASSSDSSRKSSETACTTSSAKEIDDGSSIDLGLNFDFNLGKENTTCPKKPALTVPRPKVDLQLSLSIGRSESGITGITPVLTSNYVFDEIRSFTQVSTQDEGSTSSRWKHGNKLMHYLNSTEKSGTILPERTICDIMPARFPDFSLSTMMDPQKISVAASGVTHTEQRCSSTKNCQAHGCSKGARGSSGLCIAHGGGRRCQKAGCQKGAEGRTVFCKAHGGGRPFCKAHGGGKRCAFQAGCSKSVHGGTQFCVAHGGGKRCTVPECTKSARGRTNFCVRHGGGKRCKAEGCGKSAQGSTDFCKAHGGGKRCLWGQPGSNIANGSPPCDRFARGKRGLCAAHIPLVEDHCVHGEHQLLNVDSDNLALRKHEKMKEIVDLELENRTKTSTTRGGLHQKQYMHPANDLGTSMAYLPEGRVHGGNLMALLGSK